MSIKLSMQEKPHYLHVICSGEFEPDAFIDACREALAFASENRIAAVVIDGRTLTGEFISIIDRFKIGEEFARLQHGLPFISRVAVIGNEPLVDPGRFAETVAVNRGAFGRVFTDMEKAIRWLEI